MCDSMDLRVLNDQEITQEHDKDKIIMVLDTVSDKLGCLVYERNTNILNVLPEDLVLLGNKSNSTQSLSREIILLIESLLIQYNPSKIIISSKFDEECYSYLTEKFEQEDTIVDIKSFKPFKSNEELKYIKVIDSITKKQTETYTKEPVKVSELTQACIKQCMEYIIDSSIDTDVIFNSVTDSKSIRKSRSTRCHFLIKKLYYIQLQDRVLIDDHTIHSLHILPGIRKFGSDNIIKNGCFSLLELLDHTNFRNSKRLLKSWVVSPTSSYDILEKRYNMLDTLLSTENYYIFDELQILLKKVSDINNIILKLKTGTLTIYNWRKLQEFLTYGIEIYRHLSALKFNEQNIDIEILELPKLDIIGNFEELLTYILNIIDFEESKERDEIVIREGLFFELDNLIKCYNELENTLSTLADEINNQIFAQKNSRIIKDSRNQIVNAVYIPQLGFLITVELNLKDQLDNTFINSWEIIFETETHRYYKTGQTNELDNNIGDIYSQIEDIKLDILIKLQEHIINNVEMLLKFDSITTKLDVYMSLAFVCKSMNYRRPKLVENENILIIKKGRHPLLETIIQNYIPNDFCLRGGLTTVSSISDAEKNHWNNNDNQRIAIVTGANASGKSVYMTQVGLIVYLAHIGCFVPVESAVIGIVDMILSKIQTKESLSINHSSFELDNINMMKNLSVMTERSLMLIDEFGKGTDVINGPALCGGLLMYLRNSKICPRIICCTHYHELFQDNLISPRTTGLQFYTTEIVLNQRSNDDLNEITNEENRGIVFMYRIKEGICDDSYGIHCASISGVPSSIIRRANELKNQINQGYDIVALCSTISSEDDDKFEVNQEILKRYLIWDLELESVTTSNELKSKLASLIEHQQDFIE